MIMHEQWTQWRPIEQLAPQYYMTALIDDVTGFYIRLGESKNNPCGLFITFERSIDACRVTDEGDRFTKLLYLIDTYGRDFFVKWAFFKVTNSEYLEWLSQESGSIFDSKSMEHFALITQDSIIDIASRYEPKIELIADITQHKVVV
jgi:hypothetical protein